MIRESLLVVCVFEHPVEVRCLRNRWLSGELVLVSVNLVESIQHNRSQAAVDRL